MVQLFSNTIGITLRTAGGKATPSGVRSLVVKHGCWLLLIASKCEAIGF